MPTYDENLEVYNREVFAPEDEILAKIRSEIPKRGLPAITVRPEEGRFLQFLIAASGSKLVLEIGTLGGYSGTWMARGLPAGGRLITLEISPEHAEVANEHFDMAGVADLVDVRVGNAHHLLPKLADEGPFDFVFIDAEKEGYLAYLDWTVDNLRPRGIVAAHNAFRSGAVTEDDHDDPSVGVVAEFNRRLSNEKRFIPTLFPAGDGTAVAVLRKSS